MHTLTSETKLKPKKYVDEFNPAPTPLVIGSSRADTRLDGNRMPSIAGDRVENIKGIYDDFFDQESKKYGYNYHDEPHDSRYPSSHQKEQMQSGISNIAGRTLGSRMMEGHEMMAAERCATGKFEAISMGGKDLTKIMIDGFQVDLERVAQKAREIAPLPPSKLPIIFIDHELNFYHHFFQGVELMVGRSYLDGILQARTYHADMKADIALSLRDIINVGYEEEDNETTVFTKTVLRATLELAPRIKQVEDNPVFLVAANLYGFQYLEDGMKLKEADIRMWLSICWNHYRTSWFNTFKSSGVPSFAVQGVNFNWSSTSGPQEVIPREEKVKMIEAPKIMAPEEVTSREIIARAARSQDTKTSGRRRRHGF